MYRDPMVKMRKDEGLRMGLVYAVVGLIVLGIVQSIALALYF